MKKTVLSAAIFAALASTNVSAAEVYNNETSKVDIYGKIQGMYYAGDKLVDGDESYFRLGVKAKSEINANLEAFGRFEVEYAADKDDDVDVRLGYAGLGSDYGALSYGRQYGAYTLVADFTDVLYEFGGDASGTGTDQFGTGKADSLLKYAIEVNNFAFEANYQLDNDKEGDDMTSYGLAAVYTFDFGLGFGVAHNAGERATGLDDSSMTALAVKYENNGIYAAFLYSLGENFNKAEDFNADNTAMEAALGYEFANGFSVLAGYNVQETDVKGNNVKFDNVDYYTVGAEYKFNKNFKVFAEYLINNAESADVGKKDAEDVLAIAAVYKF
ncbi:porin [Motilimonas pumila]|nr:porin [Motilimonas pumila]